MKTTNKNSIWLACALVLVLVIACVASLFSFFKQLKQADDIRQHTYTTLGIAQVLLSSLKDAETGHLGFLLTGDEAFLEPYLAERNDINGQLEQLQQLTNIPSSREHLAAIFPLVKEKLSEMGNIIELRRSKDMAAVIEDVRAAEGKRLIDLIRTELHGFMRIEQDELALRELAFHAKMRHLFAIIVFSSLFMSICAAAFMLLIYRNTQQQLKYIILTETKRLLDAQEATNKELQQAYSAIKAREKASIEEGALQRAIFNSANFSSIATDAKGVIQIFNVGAEHMLGYEAADVINKITPADISDPQEVIARAATLSTELETPISPGFEALVFKASRGIEDIYELTYIRKDGSRVPAVVSVTALRDGQEIIIGYLLIGTDNTARKHVESEQKKLTQRLQDQQFYTRSLIESNIDALMTTDPSGIISDVNKQMESLTGSTRDELIGAPFKNYFTNPQLAEDGIKRVLNENRVTNYELTARARDGKETEVSYNATTFYDRDGALQGVFAAARDITERKRFDRVLEENTLELETAKSVAEKANLAKSDFLSSMSHELRTPLSAILGFAQLIESGDPAPSPAQKRSLNQILQAGWYLLDLINEILDLALIESGKLSLSIEPVLLAEVMEECQSMIEPQARKHGIKMTFPRVPMLHIVYADHMRLKQVLINLLSNAIKYNCQGGSVILSCNEHTKGRLRIIVKDTGEGLSAENVAQLFQPFNRLGQEQHDEEGTGIGLVLTKRLTELMGGSIGLESKVGKGSTFWVELNLTSIENKEAIEETTPINLKMPLKTNAQVHTLLYVEDNPANLMLIEDLISRRPDIYLITARDGPTGAALAQSALPTAILMDINLPGISGLDVLQLLRKDTKTAHIPVVALSANAMPRDVEKGIKAGFFRYLTKPIKVNEFMETLKLTLEYADKKGSNSLDAIEQ
ncbi:MAG: PAS domain S-box-containing protein [Lentisphaeria bacterium]|jgi:PAS domain S-box-containing protein